MVGWLIEGKEVVRLEHELCHGKACTFSSAQDGNLFVYVFAFEEEGGKDISEFQPYIPDCNPVERTEDRIFLVKDIFLILCASIWA